MLLHERLSWHRTGALLALLATAGCQATTQTDSGVPVAAPTASPAASADAHRHPGPTRDSADAGGMHRMDPDTRFMHHMIAHHAQALAMTELVASRATDPGFRLLTERIEISQNDEIALMRRWLEQRGRPVPDSAHARHMRDMSMPGMLSDQELGRLAAATGREFERLFLELMIRHHEGALTMVGELFGSQGAAQDSELFRLASDIEADQRAEIARMRRMLAAMGPRP